jgi:predicted transcriptional regulator
MSEDSLLLQRKEMLEGIRRGERAVEGGRILTQDEAKERMARWLTAALA